MNKRFIGQPDTNDDAFEAMLEQSDFKEKRVSLGDEVRATVVRIGQEYLFLDLGSRNEGLLARIEGQEDEEEIKIGTVMTVFVTSMRDGAILCARRMSAAGAAAERKTDDKSETLAQLQEAFNSGIPVEGTVKESNKGGYSVTILGQRAFCPISQIDNKFTESPEVHLEKSYTFEIIKFEEGGRNIVVSRRNLLERAAEESARRVWQTLELGQTFEGTVESVRPFGAFVDIGGVQGLLHVSEISYDRIEDPAEVLESGQTIRVAIKELDPERKRISLSLKALQADPWTELDKHIKVQNVYKGRVTRIAQFGAFVELMPGVDGLVHISQLGAEQRVRSPRDVVAQGQEVEVKVLEIDAEARRISLTMRTDEQAEDNWREELAAVKDDSGSAGMGTLADLLKSKLDK